jgi:hypothetical protein
VQVLSVVNFLKKAYDRFPPKLASSEALVFEILNAASKQFSKVATEEFGPKFSFDIKS